TAWDGPAPPARSVPGRLRDPVPRAAGTSLRGPVVARVGRGGARRRRRAALRRARYDPRTIDAAATATLVCAQLSRQSIRQGIQRLRFAFGRGSMTDAALRYSVTRRRFLRDATLTSLALIAPASAPSTTGTPGSGGGAATKGAEFHAGSQDHLPPE